ncbi:hypothetical protein [Kribbella italica]|uniref:Uncharacterized protein n=1 Tax=Kribbella italica TaxID=1540520 RepID=A0A7W9J4Y2_9ACTN|nr:hypothetical protein [Kribbella italica]MBB5835684.1 hypothetical protein [Kribbella italica]
MSNHRSIASRAYSALGRITWKVIRRKAKTSTSRNHGSKPATRAKARRTRS